MMMDNFVSLLEKLISVVINSVMQP